MIKKFSIFLILIVVFLIPKHSFAANYYFNAAIDNDWSNVLNWWEDAGFTIQASVIPGTGDDVSISGAVYAVNSGEASVYSAVFQQGVGWASGNSSLTVSDGGLVFESQAYIYNNGSTIYSASTTFNGAGYNEGTMYGNVIFNDSSYNNGIVNGNAIFEYASGGTITITNRNS